MLLWSSVICWSEPENEKETTSRTRDMIFEPAGGYSQQNCGCGKHEASEPLACGIWSQWAWLNFFRSSPASDSNSFAFRVNTEEHMEIDGNSINDSSVQTQVLQMKQAVFWTAENVPWSQLRLAASRCLLECGPQFLMIQLCQFWLVVWTPPLWKRLELVNWDDDIPNIWEKLGK